MRGPLRLYLMDGVDASKAIEALTVRIQAAENLSGSVAREGIDPGSNARYMVRRQTGYAEWVEVTEMELTNLTRDADVLEMPYTSAYWEILRLTSTTPRAVAVIEAEIRRQIAGLEGLCDDLKRRLDRARAAPGHITVLDTNVLLHHQLPDNVNWREIIDQREVRIVIPLRVIEELDAKKYSESDRLRDRARKRLPHLYKLVGAGGAPETLNGYATIEVFIEPDPRVRPADADTEILETARDLRRLSDQGVTIVTGDTGMRLRAEAEGLPTASMPTTTAA
jgi:rRNA-processing protein FCF1